MDIIREIREVKESTISVDVPERLLNRKVEITVIPLDELPSRSEIKETEWPHGFFENTAGCLADDPIQRYPQLRCHESSQPIKNQERIQYGKSQLSRAHAKSSNIALC